MALWFGQEWEIAFSGSDASGVPVPIAIILKRIDEALVRNLPHVSDENNGWWLASGGKFYRDASEGGLAHDEYASPECGHPDELVRQELAAERLMLGLAALAADGPDLAEVRVSKANVCGVSGLSWGSHENYETSKPVPAVAMLAWLASRVAVTGSGGIDVTYPGIRFTLSPRAHFMCDAVNSATQWGRGLHNVGKAAPHGSRHRVHVIAGDGNRMPLSSWLRFGTTALATAMMDAGNSPEIRLVDAVAALHQFALDLELAIAVPEQSGGVIRMLEIQRAFHARAAATMDRFPAWAPQVLGEWERVLDALAAQDGWRKLVGRLDWPTKRMLCDRVLDRAGWSWQRVDAINLLLDEARRQADAERAGGRAAGPAQDSEPPPPESIERLLRGRCTAGEIGGFTALRRHLLEVDARYMQLGPQSLFDRVSNQPARFRELLEGFPADPFDLPQPGAGRAAVRARLVREHGWKGPITPGNSGLRASWTRFLKNDKWLSLAEVEGPAELTWQELPEPGEMADDRLEFTIHNRIERMARLAVSRAGSAVDSGHYRSGLEALGYPGNGPAARATEQTPAERWKHVIRLLARAQDAVGLEEAIAHLGHHESTRLEWLWEAANGRILIGLAGDPTVPALIPTVLAELAATPNPRPSGAACWKSHFAVWLIRLGRIDEAYQTLRSIRATGEYEGTSISVRSRIEAQFGEVWRLYGETDKAREHIDRACSLCEEAGLGANHMDYALTGRARLLADEGNRGAAAQLLRRTVLPYQRSRDMPSALWTLVLIARVMPRSRKPRASALLAAVNREADAHSGFRTCARVAKLLTHWDAWCAGDPDPAPAAGAEVRDFFWGI